MFFASVGIITACLVLTGSFALLAYNLDFNLNNLISENEFVAYVDPELSDAQARALQSSIEAAENVTEVHYISSQEAMASYLERLGGGGQLYAELPEDLLPARYAVHIAQIDLLEQTAEKVESLDGVSHISMSLSVAQGFSSTKKASIAVALFLLVILLAVSLFIISNSIRMALQGREEEIAVMKLVGATNRFIRGPFLVEGLLLGVLSSLCAFALECGFYLVVQRILAAYQIAELFSIIPFGRLAPWLLLAYLGSGIFIGVFGSMIAIRRLLNV